MQQQQEENTKVEAERQQKLANEEEKHRQDLKKQSQKRQKFGDGTSTNANVTVKSFPQVSSWDQAEAGSITKRAVEQRTMQANAGNSKWDTPLRTPAGIEGITPRR